MDDTPVTKKEFDSHVTDFVNHKHREYDKTPKLDVVTSIAKTGSTSLTGAVTLTAGTNITLTQSGQDITIAGATADIQVFSTAGATSWTKPTGAKIVEVYIAGGGGGGGSGRKQSSPANISGASGGGGGSLGFKRFNASSLAATENLTVGAGGAGGAAKSGANADGNAGVDGGFTTFGTTVLLKAYGGIKGLGGSTANVNGGVGGAVGNGDYTQVGGDGGLSRSDDADGQTGVDTALLISPRGGGAGGGYNAVGTPKNGGIGGGFITNYVKAGGPVQSPGLSSIGLFYGGTGGGGGAAAGQPGGAGINGSGGGGGACEPTTSGAGGVGGDGYVIVISYF